MAGTTDAQALLLTVSADTSKALKAVEALNKRLEGLAPEMTRHAKRAAEGIEKELGGIKFGEAGKKIFDSARFATLEEGGAKLRIFGSALEPLGGLGIAAAAGVVALSEALAQAHEAIEYADGLYKAAQAAHVSTDALQEYRAAVVKAGGDANQAGGSLLAFSQTLGKAQEGLVRAQRGFLALGFSKEQIKAFKDAPDALDAAVAKIQNLAKSSDKDAAIEQLGLTGLAPLILKGADAWKEYRDEAKGAGLVLDADVIKRGHELNVQMDELTGKIKNELTTAFIDLGPVLVGLLKLLSGMLEKIEAFLALVRDPRNGDLFRSQLSSPSTGAAVSASTARSLQAFGQTLAVGDVERGGAKTISREQLDDALGIKPPTGKGKLKDLSHTGTDGTAAFNKTAQDALDAGNEAVAKAQAALVQGIYDHAEAEKAAVDAGLKKKLDDLAAEALKIAAAKNDTDKAAQLAKISEARSAQQLAAVAEKELIDRKAEAAHVEQVIKTRDFIRAQEAKIAANEASMAATLAERNVIEKRNLAEAQALELKDFDARAAQSLVGKSGDDLASAQRNISNERAKLVAGQTSDTAAQAFNQAGPIEKYARSIQDLNTEVQGDAVTAFQSLTSGLVDAALHAKNLGDVAKNVFLELIQQILTQTLQKEAVPALASLAAFIPGFASGTSSAPGGLAIVGEKGPELVNLPRGSQVTPSFQSLNALASMKAPSAAPAQVYAPAQFDLRGAVVTQDLLDQMNHISASHSAKAAQVGRRLAVQDIQRAGYAGNLNQ